MTYKQIIQNHISMKAGREADEILAKISGKKYFFLDMCEITTKPGDDSISFDFTAKREWDIFRIHGYVDRWGNVNTCVIWLELGDHNNRLIWDCIEGANKSEAKRIR